jgi:hypothetical protein
MLHGSVSGGSIMSTHGKKNGECHPPLGAVATDPRGVHKCILSPWNFILMFCFPTNDHFGGIRFKCRETEHPLSSAAGYEVFVS